jgi:hypothetical protein
MDRYSADAVTDAPLAEPAAEAMRDVIPVPLEYPGAPHSRFWEIEDANVAVGLESRWQPYLLDWKAGGEFVYRQWGLAGDSLQHPRPMPHAQAQVLKAGNPLEPKPHSISAAAIAQGGL